MIPGSVLIAAILIQQVENLILVPRLMADKLHVSPLAIARRWRPSRK